MSLQLRGLEMKLNKNNVIGGSLIYAIGDLIGSVIVGDFSWTRTLGLSFVGGFLYAWEIPSYFSYLDSKLPVRTFFQKWLRAFFAMLFFNPFWITRHYAIIAIASGQWKDLNWGLFSQALHSFVVVMPASLIGNYLIQTKCSIDWRYIFSALFSASLAIYYAIARVCF